MIGKHFWILSFQWIIPIWSTSTVRKLNDAPWRELFVSTSIQVYLQTLPLFVYTGIIGDPDGRETIRFNY